MIKLIDSPKRYLLKLLPESLAMWRFRDNLNDSSPNNHHLTNSGYVAGDYTTGYTESGNTVIVGDGSSWGTIAGGDATDFEMGSSTDFTVEIIFKTTHTSLQYPIRHNNNSDLEGWVLQITNSGVVNFYMGDGTWRYHTGDTKVNDGEWHYIACCVDRGNDELRVYIDGILDRNSPWDISGLNDIGLTNPDSLYCAPQMTGSMDEASFIKGKALTEAEVKDRTIARRDLRSFTTDKNGVALYHQKYNKPVSKLKFADTVYNVLTYGIRSVWKVDDGTGYSTAYTGYVLHPKFYYGKSIPETLVGYNSVPQWKVNYDGFFRPPIDADYTFYLAGEGNLSYSITNEGTVSTSSGINKTLDETTYTSFTVSLLSDSAYAFDFGYTYNKEGEAGFAVLWKTDSASFTPDKILLSGGVCNPADNNSFPELENISYYSNANLTVNANNISTLKFEVPFISTSNNYGYKGYLYDTTNILYYDTNNPSIKLKEYKMIEYSEGYVNADNEDETVVKFTGQIRNIDTKYSKTGDKLLITCNDYNIFTKDAINLQSPTPIDYWQTGYITESPGRANGLTKPQTFDGWELHKVYEIMLTESYIDAYSMRQRKEHLNYLNIATSGGFYIEPINSSVTDYLQINKKYGIEPIGEFNDSKSDDKYNYSVDAGEFYQDAINKILKPWYYKWGFNRYGYPFLKRIQVPQSYVDSQSFSYSNTWAQGANVSAFKGTYQYSSASSIYTQYAPYDVDSYLTSGNIRIPLGDNSVSWRSASSLPYVSASDYCELNWRATLLAPGWVIPKGKVRFYCTSDASNYLNATTWPILDSTFVYHKTEDHSFKFSVTDTAFGRAQSIGIIVDYSARLDDDDLTIGSMIFTGDTIYYNTSDATVYLTGGIATTTVTGKKFGLLMGRGPSCGESTASVGTFRVKLKKGNDYLVNTTVNARDDSNWFYYDGSNSSGINKSYISIANGLPYDTYNLEIESINDGYETRIEGVLSFEEDYEVPVDILYPDDSVKKGSITKLNVKKDSKDQRNDIVILGKRIGTLLQVNEDGEEIVLNPNNETNVYVQSAVRDLNSIYKSTSTNYVGRPRTTVIVDPSIVNKDQANHIGINFIEEYSYPERKASFSIMGNPSFEIDDCIAIKESFKQGINEGEYLWITNLKSDFKKSYTSNFQTTPIKPVSSYWSRPALDISAFNGLFIYNLKIKNKGIMGLTTGSMLTTDTTTTITNSLNATAASYSVPAMGYFRIGRELIKYDYRDITASEIRLGGLTRGLGEDGVAYINVSNQPVVLGYNPYSIKQQPPTISFDLLRDADVAVHILHHNEPDAPVFNEDGTINRLSPLKRTILSPLKIDALTDIEGNLNSNSYEYFPAGHYEFVWGGWDRLGNYNNEVVEGDDFNRVGSQFYANEAYKLRYTSITNPYFSGFSPNSNYSTGYGMFKAEILVLPIDEKVSYKYDSVGGSGVSTAYLADSSGANGSIKQILNSPGVVDLIIATAGMRCVNQDTIVDGFTTAKYRQYSWATSDPSRTPGNIMENSIAATNFPTSNPSGFTFSSVPAFILNESNLNNNGDARGFKWEIQDYSPDQDDDINRYYLSTLKFKIVQLAWAQLGYNWDGDPIQIFNEVTSGEVGQYEQIKTIRFNTPYYFNVKRVLDKENKPFIPESALVSFKKYNQRTSGAPMMVSNYTIFLDSLYDISGRKAKQTRTYTLSKPRGSFAYDFPDSISFVSGAMDVHLWNLDPKIPFYWPGSTVNRGMYEFTLNKTDDFWKFTKGGNPIPDRRFYGTEAQEFRIRPGVNVNAGQKSEGVDVGYWHYGLARSNFVTWLDDASTREIVFFDHDKFGAIFPNTLAKDWEAQDFFMPYGWSRYKRSDFGE